MEKNDLVSIVIPCYNQAKYLKESVQSAVKQTYDNMEVIIVNDGSLDDTQRVAEKLQTEYPDIIRVIKQENQGLSEARNTGIRESLGEYIFPLDADDKIDKSMVSKTVKAMIQDNVDVISTDTQCFGKETSKIVPIKFPDCNLLYANCWIGNSLLRREVWVETGGYKKNMSGGYEDWEFWINAYKHGFRFQRYPEVLFYYRTKEESMFTTAQNKDKYLKSKIVMNHPELYTVPNVQEAISVIKETEELADLYFYCDKSILGDEQMLIRKAGEYIHNNLVDQKQIIEVDNQKIGLCNLDMFENLTSLEKLCEEMGAIFILFFAPIRYELEALKTNNYAWDEEEGVIKAIGTFFPFVFKVERDNPDGQLTAYKRLVKFQDKKLNMYILRSKEHLDVMIENHDKAIKVKDKEISQNSYKLAMLLDAIEKVTKVSIRKNPIIKYKAYKVILKTYYQLREFKK